MYYVFFFHMFIIITCFQYKQETIYIFENAFVWFTSYQRAGMLDSAIYPNNDNEDCVC